MLVPKRHFVEFIDMNKRELDEFRGLYKFTLAKLKSMGLNHSDGSKVDRYLFFWRYRQNQLDPITKVIKSDHFHFHIVPEKEHLWDPIIDEKATKINMDKLIEHFRI